MLKKRGFTILEVLLSAIFIVSGVAATVAVVYSGKFFLKQAENKSRAINVAWTKMEENLAKSFSDPDFTGPLPKTITGTEGNITWTVALNSTTQGVAPRIVPYRTIQVTATYAETSPAGGASETRSVILKNIIPYPYLHTRSLILNQDDTLSAPFCDCDGTQVAHYSRIGPDLNGGVLDENAVANPYLEIEVNHPVTKEVQVFYNIALKIQDATGVDSADTIYSACFIRNPATGSVQGPIPVIARTPIMSQPLISHAVGLTTANGFSLPPGRHIIEVRWFKRTGASNAGIVSLKSANLILVLFEKR